MFGLNYGFDLREFIVTFVPMLITALGVIDLVMYFVEYAKDKKPSVVLLMSGTLFSTFGIALLGSLS